MFAIEAEGLEKSYGSHVVLAGVDLRVPVGSVFALLGQNGAGKTTMVRILSTLSRATGGRARVAGHDVVSQRRSVRRSISLTGQYAALDDLLSSFGLVDAGPPTPVGCGGGWTWRRA